LRSISPRTPDSGHELQIRAGPHSSKTVIICILRPRNETYISTSTHPYCHCNALQLAATHCSTLQHTATYYTKSMSGIGRHSQKEVCYSMYYTPCNTLQLTATVSSELTLQHTATHCNTLQHTATLCNTLQHTATSGKLARYY